MDWNLFWSAFGAIGSTCGSLLTAGAVLVAIKQYKQPLTKLVRVNFGRVITNGGDAIYHIYVQNKGIRPVEIREVGIKFDKKTVEISPMFDVINNEMPITIQQEKVVNFIYESEKVNPIVKKAIEKKDIQSRKKVVFYVKDSFGEEYICKTEVKAKDLINNR